jgi:hypothetical protein
LEKRILLFIKYQWYVCHSVNVNALWNDIEAMLMISEFWFWYENEFVPTYVAAFLIWNYSFRCSGCVRYCIEMVVVAFYSSLNEQNVFTKIENFL